MGSNDHIQRNLIDVSATADRLGVSVRYVRRLVAERRIPYFKLGHLLRFDSAEVDDWLDRTRVDEINPGNAASHPSLPAGARLTRRT